MNIPGKYTYGRQEATFMWEQNYLSSLNWLISLPTCLHHLFGVLIRSEEESDEGKNAAANMTADSSAMSLRALIDLGENIGDGENL